eukprot:6633574-Prymnesium_polylepis.1
MTAATALAVQSVTANCEGSGASGVYTIIGIYALVWLFQPRRIRPRTPLVARLSAARRPPAEPSAGAFGTGRPDLRRSRAWWPAVRSRPWMSPSAAAAAAGCSRRSAPPMSTSPFASALGSPGAVVA